MVATLGRARAQASGEVVVASYGGGFQDAQRKALEAQEAALKKDAPSGTALSLAESICKATNRNPQSDLVYGREGGGGEAPRRKNTIGMHALRMAAASPRR